jgi:hypothetical protein
MILSRSFTQLVAIEIYLEHSYLSGFVLVFFHVYSALHD